MTTRNAESRRNNLPDEQEHKLVIRDQMVSPENMHKVTYRLKLVFMNTYVHAYTYTHVTTINEKAKGGIWETSEEGKHREK